MAEARKTEQVQAQIVNSKGHAIMCIVSCCIADMLSMCVYNSNDDSKAQNLNHAVTANALMMMTYSLSQVSLYEKLSKKSSV